LPNKDSFLSNAGYFVKAAVGDLEHFKKFLSYQLFGYYWLPLWNISLLIEFFPTQSP
jgi:hypothetical protein